MSNPKKTFRFTLVHRDSGKAIVQEIVVFGNEKRPWPDDWRKNGMAQMKLIEFRDEMLGRYFEVISEEDETDTNDAEYYGEFDGQWFPVGAKLAARENGELYIAPEGTPDELIVGTVKRKK